MPLNSKTPLSEVLRNNNYAIKITSADQVKKLVPGYDRLNDLELFFQTDKNHREFISGNHGPEGSGFFFCHPQGKQILDYEEVEFDI